MADKPKFIPILNEQEADALSDPSDLSVPYTVKPNGHLWAEPDQLSKWRKANDRNGSPE